MNQDSMLSVTGSGEVHRSRAEVGQEMWAVV